MKKKNLCLLCASAILTLGIMGGVVSCDDGRNDGPTEVIDDKYTVKITAIGSTSISVSNTLQLRSSVTGTSEKTVNWSSSDPLVCSVSETGLVTGLSEGKSVITASLALDERYKATIEITVTGAAVPTSINILGAESGIGWIGDNLKLQAEVSPSDASNLVDWVSSNDKIATIDPDGNLAFLSEGNVEISAVSKADKNVKASLNFDVKLGTFSSQIGSHMWDLSSQANDPKKVSLSIEGSHGYNSLYFMHAKGTRYYAEATFKVTCLTEDTWDWQGVGLGSGLSDSDTRYFTFSPHSTVNTGNNYNKVIVRDHPTSWNDLTTRSQIWGENGLDEINCFDRSVTISEIRDENRYYYMVNGKLFYVDDTNKYDGVETYPVLISEDLPCEVTNFMASTDDTLINEKLNDPELQKSFLSSNPNCIDYQSDSNFTFESNNILSKDNKLRSIGDKAKVVRNFEIEFDFSDILVNESHIERGFTGLTVNFSRYESADSVESFMIGRSQVQEENIEYVGRYASWNYQRSMDDPDSVLKYCESSEKVIDSNTLDELHHVKITRTINESNQSEFAMSVDNNQVVFDVLSTSKAKPQERYTGAYLIWVGGEYTACSVSNFKFISNK